ncbi:hypothetical protein BGX29_002746, partial [Mortierella sp. GBA35]
MLHNNSHDNLLNIFCLVDGEGTSNAFPVKIASTDTVDDLKEHIKTKKSPEFADIAPDKLTLWRVLIPEDDEDDEIPILLDTRPEKKKLKATNKLSKVFGTSVPEDTIHIIVQRPPQGDLHVNIKRITEKFFAPGPIPDFLNVFVRGEGCLPVTTGAIGGLPRAWRRGFGKAPENRPSLLFLDLPDPSIPEMWRDPRRHRAPSQHWGFYFSASSDDWGSGDVVTLHSTVQDYLKDTREPSNMDRQINNAYARRTTLLLFLARLLIFRHCLNVPGSNGTFTSARWTLLQVCPRVFSDKDFFNILFLRLLKLLQHTLGHILDLVRDVYEDAKGCIMKHGCLPRIKDDTRLLVIHDEAQILGREVKAGFGRTSFAGGSRYAVPKFVGRFRPAIAAIERIVECNDPGAWRKTIEDAEDRLVSWANRHIKGNLCYEISRLHDKHNKYKDQLDESINNMLGLLMYQRCMFGNHNLILKDVSPQLVEHAFGRIKIIRGRAVTVMDEPFVSKTVENYFAAIDPYFAREVRKRMVKSTAIEQGCMFERFMMKVFSETFNERPLSKWPHQPPISEMCPAPVGKVEIVGWREPGLEQGTTQHMMTMEEFMDAHVNHQSTRNNLPVAPFFFPKSKPSGPDLVFFIRIDDNRVIPSFVQMKLHQGNSNFSEKDWKDALSTVSAPKIEGHAKNFRKYCPDNVYISIIVAYPTKWSDKLLVPSELPEDSSGVQQV